MSFVQQLKQLRRPVVTGSKDLERILTLPRRIDVELHDFSHLKKPKKACLCASYHRECPIDLLPIQAQGLSEAMDEQGLVGAIGVGHGKELLCQLLPLVMPNCKMAILFIPADMRESFALDWHFYGQHWRQPNLIGGSSYTPGIPRLKVVAYSTLSREKFTAELAKWQPDLIIANEGHNLCGLGSVRTGRVVNYCADHPECRFVVVSGTLTKRALKDYAHLSSMALGEGSPLPTNENTLKEWGFALDADQKKLTALPGALLTFCKPGEHVREGFQRRLRETKGVIVTTENAIGTSLSLHERRISQVPESILKTLDAVRLTGTRPDGEEMIEASDVQRCLREIASGFYYHWIFPHKEPANLIDEWFRIRQLWHREVRDLLKNPKPYLDSPLLAIRAAIRHEHGYEGDLPTWQSEYWRPWKNIRKQVYHETEAVWIDSYLASDAAVFAKNTSSLIWYTNQAFGEKVRELSGLVQYGGGPEASREILRETGERSVLASMKAHGQGKNLQMFSKNLICECPPDAALWEQLIGRTHRRGQLADEVQVYLYRHTDEVRKAFDKAEDLAMYVQQTTGNKAKILYASRDWK